MSGRVGRIASVLAAVLGFAVLWELYKLVGESTGIPLPVATDDLTMPHSTDIVGALSFRLTGFSAQGYHGWAYCT